MKIKYTLLHQDKDTKARYGTLETNYGKFETPMFMPVGTQATVKTLDPEEIKEIGLKLGAKENTFYGLSSLGDLLTTCLSNESRNNRCGILLSQGKKIDEIKEEIGMVIEGLDALKIAHDISQKYNINTKIINTLYDIIYNEKSKESIIDVVLN